MRTHRRDRGFSLISISLLISIIVFFAALIVSYALTSRKAGRSFANSVSLTQIADAGIRKAIFCLNTTSGTKCGGTYGPSYVGESNVAFGGGTFSTTVSGSGAARTVTVDVTNSVGQTKRVAADLTTIPPVDPVGFGYALQAGSGGAYLENNSTIDGTIYSGGDVVCQSTAAKIKGDAYSSKSGGKVRSCRVNAHAHADSILNSSIGGNAYYKQGAIDIAGSTVTGTSYPNSPTPVEIVLPPVNYNFWRVSAEAGGVIFGPYHPADNSHLGPTKIDGDLILDQNVDVIVDGPIWVTGNITMSNNTSFTLNSSFGAFSTAILADDPADNANHGKVNIVPNATINGSGNSKSFILIISTNSSVVDASPALTVSNNAAGAVFMAANGVLRLQNNAGAKSLAAKRLYLDQNAIVTYSESDVADAKFSKSPGGVWAITEGSWRELR